MANPFGEIAGKIAGEVAEGLTKKAAPVAKKVVKAVEDKADDWGWKGGKPGEVTGGEISKLTQNYYAPTGYASPLSDPKVRPMIDKMASKMENSRNADIRKEFAYEVDKRSNIAEASRKPGAAYIMATRFGHLEEAGVPRSLTGKVYPLLRRMTIAQLKPHVSDKTGSNDQLRAKVLAKFLKPLDSSQRDTFIQLLKDGWEGSLDDLANAAKNL